MRDLEFDALLMHLRRPRARTAPDRPGGVARRAGPTWVTGTAEVEAIDRRGRPVTMRVMCTPMNSRGTGTAIGGNVIVVMKTARIGTNAEG